MQTNNGHHVHGDLEQLPTPGSLDDSIRPQASAPGSSLRPGQVMPKWWPPRHPRGLPRLAALDGMDIFVTFGLCEMGSGPDSIDFFSINKVQESIQAISCNICLVHVCPFSFLSFCSFSFKTERPGKLRRRRSSEFG